MTLKKLNLKTLLKIHFDKHLTLSNKQIIMLGRDLFYEKLIHFCDDLVLKSVEHFDDQFSLCLSVNYI